MIPPEGPAQWACRYFDPITSYCRFWGTGIGDVCDECHEFEWKDPWTQYVFKYSEELTKRVHTLEERLDNHIVRIGLLEDKIYDLELTVSDLVDEMENADGQEHNP